MNHARLTLLILALAVASRSNAAAQSRPVKTGRSLQVGLDAEAAYLALWQGNPFTTSAYTLHGPAVGAGVTLSWPRRT